MKSILMKLDYIKKQLKTKSLSQIIAKAIKLIGWTFFIKIKCELLKFTEQPMDTSILTLRRRKSNWDGNLCRVLKRQ